MLGSLVAGLIGAGFYAGFAGRKPTAQSPSAPAESVSSDRLAAAPWAATEPTVPALPAAPATSAQPTAASSATAPAEKRRPPKPTDVRYKDWLKDPF